MKYDIDEGRKRYAAAKGMVEILEGQQRETERRYVAEKGITNPDGSVPGDLGDIGDDQVLETAIEEYTDLLHADGLVASLNNARGLLKSIENNLIDYALENAPADLRDTLEDGAQRSVIYREKIIEIALRGRDLSELETQEGPNYGGSIQII